ncbi:MAG: peptide chain release factor N(5)-glutamine methyltransferase [Phycisphaerae bacterium]
MTVQSLVRESLPSLVRESLPSLVRESLLAPRQIGLCRRRFRRPTRNGIVNTMPDPSCTTNDVWSVGRLLKWTTDFFGDAGLDDPRLSAELLLAHALDCKKIELYTRFDHQPDDSQLATFRGLIQKAVRHEPIAYLIGRKEFYSLTFEVTPDVLIPRPETEALVEQALAFCRGRPSGPIHFFDLGTGSGCIAITILTQAADTLAVAGDISQPALEVARRNAQRHSLEDRMTLVRADGIHLPADVVPPGGFDLIVSNPPYVADQQADQLPANVREHEPHQALFAGPDGLAVYRKLQAEAPPMLKPDGLMLVEIGAGMDNAVIDVMRDGVAFEHVGTWSDGADPHDRVLGFKPASPGNDKS